MITYVVGSPGSGKTYFAVYKLWSMFIRKEPIKKGFLSKILKPKAAVNKYLYAYTNINEFKFELDERLIKFDFEAVYSDLSRLYTAYKIEKKSDAELIEMAKPMRLYNVLFVVDEIHNFFKAKEDPVLVWWVTYHRHLHQDMYFITQDLTLVNNEYKRVAERFYRAIDSSKRLFSKKFKYAYFTSYKMNQVDRVNSFNVNLPFDSEVFNLYHSGADSQGKSIIKYYVAIIAVLLVFVCATIYYVLSSFASDEEAVPVASVSTAEQPSRLSPVNDTRKRPVSGEESNLNEYFYSLICIKEICRLEGETAFIPESYLQFLIRSNPPKYFYSQTKLKEHSSFFLAFDKPILDKFKGVSHVKNIKDDLNSGSSLFGSDKSRADKN